MTRDLHRLPPGNKWKGCKWNKQHARWTFVHQERSASADHRQTQQQGVTLNAYDVYNNNDNAYAYDTMSGVHQTSNTFKTSSIVMYILVFNGVCIHEKGTKKPVDIYLLPKVNTNTSMICNLRRFLEQIQIVNK